MKFFEEKSFDRRNWILDNLKKLDVSPIEALVLLEIDFLNQYNEPVSLDSLSKMCNCSKNDIDDAINSLNHKGYLKMKTDNGIVFDIDSIFEANKDMIEKNDLFGLFEKEFRRVLSQKEITTIAEWERNYGYDKTVEALKLAVINRMMTDKELSFNYIGKILANG
ncbi:MAG: DnaD domain protein [Erysipelotrichaceae bacterium]